MSKHLRLLHLIDSSIPTGAFAYSYGLESAINFGFVGSSGEFRNYLYSFLQQSLSFELPFVNTCFQLNIDSGLIEVLEEYEAMMLIPCLHKASLVQGKNWLRLLESFYPSVIPPIKGWFTSNHLPVHYIFVLALCLKQLEYNLQDVRRMYLHMALRDQISAAIRLGFIGAMEGHKLQHDFYPVLNEMELTNKNPTYAQAYKTAFMVDSIQAFHQDIYSRLFQN